MEQSGSPTLAVAVAMGNAAAEEPQPHEQDGNDLPLVKSSHHARSSSSIQDYNDSEDATDGSESLNSEAGLTNSSTTTNGTSHGSHCKHEGRVLFVDQTALKGKAREVDPKVQAVSNGSPTCDETKAINGQQVNQERVDDIHQATQQSSQPEEEAELGDHCLFSSRARAPSAGKPARESEDEDEAAASKTLPSDQSQSKTKDKAAVTPQHESTASAQDVDAPSNSTAPLAQDADDGTSTPAPDLPNEQLWAFQEQLDDTTAALSVNVPDEQLWALKLTTAARDVLEFFLRSLACVRIDSPAYEFAAIVKSLVLIALGFGMPISRLACSSGQDWRTCTLTLADLKFTKVAKPKDDQEDEDEDEVFACAKPHDHVVVEICTDKLIGASAKKWILKSSPDLLHSTLTPTSMAPLAEILYEPYNPMETFLETLGWRGLVVDEATGKLYRPSSATASNSLRFVSEGNDGDVSTPVEPVFHAASRSLPRIFGTGPAPLTSFNPNSSPFTQVRSSSRPTTGLWAATTQPLPKKRLEEYVRSVTQGTGGHRIAEELLGSRSKVLEDEREWTGDVAENTADVSDPDSLDEVDSAAATRRQQVSDAAAFAEEVKKNRAARGSKKKSKDKESSSSSSNLNLNASRGGFPPPNRTQYYQTAPPPPPPFYRRRRGRYAHYWPHHQPAPGPHMPPHLYYGYGYGYPPMGYAQPPYYPAYGGYASPQAARGGYASYPAGVDSAGGAGATSSAAGYGTPAPSAAYGSVPGASNEVKTDQFGFPDLVRLDDDEDDDDTEGLETLPQLPGQRLPPEHDATHFYQTPEQMVSSGCGCGDETPTPARRDTTYTFSYGLGGEHYVRRDPTRVRALILWRPNTFIEDARRAAERREWSKEDLLEYAKELHTRSAHADEQPGSIKKDQADTVQVKVQEHRLAFGAKTSTARVADGRQVVLTDGDDDNGGGGRHKDDVATANATTISTSQQLIIYNRCSLTELVVKAMLRRDVS